jgi:hypothetical protein
MLLDRLQPYNKKRLQVLPAAPLIESKGVTRATNATAGYHKSAFAPSEFGSTPPALRRGSWFTMLEKLDLAKPFLCLFQSLIGTAEIPSLAGNHFVSVLNFFDHCEPSPVE